MKLNIEDVKKNALLHVQLSPKMKDSSINTDLNDFTRKVKNIVRKKNAVVLVIETTE